MRTHALVEYVLLNNHQARNSDIELILSVWAEQGLHFSDQQRQILKQKCSKPETIRRIRQKLQEEGKYRADKQVEDARYEKYVEARQSFGITSPEETEQVISKAVHVEMD